MEEIALSDSAGESLLNLARWVIRDALAGGGFSRAHPRLEALLAEPTLAQPAGCFVTLHVRDTHALRGCVGRLDASLPLARVVRTVAENVLDDPRFTGDPVRLEELESLEIEISVVSPLRPAPGPLDFDPARHGIYLAIDGRSGCFLPQVARETGWGREQLLERLCTEKMGLGPSAWRRSDAALSVFTTFTIGPEPFGGS